MLSQLGEKWKVFYKLKISDTVQQRSILRERRLRYDCLPSLLGDGDKEMKIMYGEEKIFYTRPTRATKAGHVEPNEPTEEGPFSFVLFESPFASVSIVNRGHASLVYREVTIFFYKGTVQP
jgi:hypothetical protein